MQFLSIRLFAILFAVSVILSGLLIYRLNGDLAFAIALPPGEAEILASRVQMIRIAGLVFAMMLMLSVIFFASRAGRSALALRWLLGALTSVAFFRAAGLVGPLLAHDHLLIGLSVIQLFIEALAILVLYGPDADGWFNPPRWRHHPGR